MFKFLLSLVLVLLISNYVNATGSSLSVANSYNGTVCEEGVCTMIQMPYRFLGRSGLKVSVLSYGNWVTFANQVTQEDDAFSLMKTAYLGGVNFFDTAEGYMNGAAEELMGRAIQRGISEGIWKRQELVISTKIFFGEKGPNSRGLSRKHILEGLSNSLLRLRLDYVDLVFAHRPDPPTPMEEVVRAFNWVIERGFAFYWGTSEWSAAQIQEAHTVAARFNLIPPLMEQPEYSLLVRNRVEKEYSHLYNTVGLGTTIWSPLASGLLTGKYNSGEIPENSRFANEKIKMIGENIMKGGRYGKFEDVVQKVKEMSEIARELGCTPAQLAIAWCVINEHVSTVILGATSVAQLNENLNSLKVVPLLNNQVLERIDAIFENKPVPDFNWRNF